MGRLLVPNERVPGLAGSYSRFIEPGLCEYGKHRSYLEKSTFSGERGGRLASLEQSLQTAAPEVSGGLATLLMASTKRLAEKVRRFSLKGGVLGLAAGVYLVKDYGAVEAPVGPRLLALLVLFGGFLLGWAAVRVLAWIIDKESG